MKIIDNDTMLRMQAMFDAGASLRATARELGLDRGTVAKYYKEGPARLCACGRPLTHNGLCNYRVARLPGRLGYLREVTTNKSERTIYWQQWQTIANMRGRLAEASRRLDRAWFRRATVSNNTSVDFDALSARVSARCQRLPEEIRDDAAQAIFVAFYSGDLDENGFERSPITNRIINREWRMIWRKADFSLDQSLDGSDADSHGVYGIVEPAMTQEEFSEIAWRDFVLWASEHEGMRSAFKGETGLTLFPHVANALDAMIDAATGANEKTAAEFVKWVTINHWGIDAAPASYREFLSDADKERA